MFIHDAIEGAFSQTYENLEIILSDDCSTDETYEIMEELVSRYRGPHRIILNKNPVNLGICQHYNKVCNLAAGMLLINAAGDDISMPSRVSILFDTYFNCNPKPSLLCSNAVSIDRFGVQGDTMLKDASIPMFFQPQDQLDTDAQVLGCTVAIHRSLVTVFEPIRKDIFAEDVVLARRANLLNGIYFIPDVLVKYRHHNMGVSQMMSGSFSRNAYLDYQIRWARDRQFRLKQIRNDIIKISQQHRKKTLLSIFTLELIEKRQLAILQGTLADSITALILETLEYMRRSHAHVKGIYKSFLIRWLPFIKL